MVSGRREDCRLLGRVGKRRGLGGSSMKLKRQKLPLFIPKGEEGTSVQVEPGGGSLHPEPWCSSPCSPVWQPWAWPLWLAKPLHPLPNQPRAGASRCPWTWTPTLACCSAVVPALWLPPSGTLPTTRWPRGPSLESPPLPTSGTTRTSLRSCRCVRAVQRRSGCARAVLEEHPFLCCPHSLGKGCSARPILGGCEAQAREEVILGEPGEPRDPPVVLREGWDAP